MQCGFISGWGSSSSSESDLIALHHRVVQFINEFRKPKGMSMGAAAGKCHVDDNQRDCWLSRTWIGSC